jgi:hypothetical protein
MNKHANGGNSDIVLLGFSAAEEGASCGSGIGAGPMLGQSRYNLLFFSFLFFSFTDEHDLNCSGRFLHKAALSGL